MARGKSPHEPSQRQPAFDHWIAINIDPIVEVDERIADYPAEGKERARSDYQANAPDQFAGALVGLGWSQVGRQAGAGLRRFAPEPPSIFW